MRLAQMGQIIVLLDKWERKKYIMVHDPSESELIKIILQDGSTTAHDRHIRISQTLKTLADELKDPAKNSEIPLHAISLATWNQIFGLVNLEGDLSPLEVLCIESNIEKQHKRHFEQVVKEQLEPRTLEELAKILFAANYLHIQPLLPLAVSAYSKKLLDKHVEHAASRETRDVVSSLLKCFSQQQAIPKK